MTPTLNINHVQVFRSNKIVPYWLKEVILHFDKNNSSLGIKNPRIGKKSVYRNYLVIYQVFKCDYGLVLVWLPTFANNEGSSLLYDKSPM